MVNSDGQAEFIYEQDYLVSSHDIGLPSHGLGTIVSRYPPEAQAKICIASACSIHTDNVCQIRPFISEVKVSDESGMRRWKRIKRPSWFWRMPALHLEWAGKHATRERSAAWNIRASSVTMSEVRLTGEKSVDMGWSGERV